MLPTLLLPPLLPVAKSILSLRRQHFEFVTFSNNYGRDPHSTTSSIPSVAVENPLCRESEPFWSRIGESLCDHGLHQHQHPSFIQASRYLLFQTWCRSSGVSQAIGWRFAGEWSLTSSYLVQALIAPTASVECYGSSLTLSNEYLNSNSPHP